jgi:hypothetical protein
MFDWAMLVFFTTNLIVRVLKANVINNLQAVTDNYTMVGFIATAVFGCLFSMVFELKAFILALSNKKQLSHSYALASGVLSLGGVIMAIPAEVLTFSLHGAATIIVYGLLGFAPPISLIVLANLLNDKLEVQMATGGTLKELIQREFEKSMKELFEPKKPKENPFTKLLVNTDNEPETRTYQRKIS